MSSLRVSWKSITISSVTNYLTNYPPKRDVNFEINLQTDEPPPVRPVIRLSQVELTELRRQLHSLLSRGLIRPSSSPHGALVFFVKKGNGKLAVDMSQSGTKNHNTGFNPVPLIIEAFNQAAGAKCFFKIDLIGACHQMRIKEEDVHKTAIRTRFGLLRAIN